jgi:GalNAc-alpha-(1->4)-GalNAc-alpha-(1->3)-diNAcBac-PP-undecaprenol alpha-1,4-N-acetyl-D-galactosaminyltransferase
MAFGLPCISTDCQSGPSELITHGENGFLIPVEDEQALQVHLEQLITDETLRNHFGQQALKTAKTYEIDPISYKWSNFIDDLL